MINLFLFSKVCFAPSPYLSSLITFAGKFQIKAKSGKPNVQFPHEELLTSTRNPLKVTKFASHPPFGNFSEFSPFGVYISIPLPVVRAFHFRQLSRSFVLLWLPRIFEFSSKEKGRRGGFLVSSTRSQYDNEVLR